MPVAAAALAAGSRSGALVRTGHDPSAIADLTYLMRPAHVRQALTFFLDRDGGKPDAYIGAIAYTHCTAAKYGVALPDDDRTAPAPGTGSLVVCGALAPWANPLDEIAKNR
jgi:hypothetical protein